MSKEVFVFGARADAEDQASRRVRFSGSVWGMPSLVNSYAHAARTLLSTAVQRNELRDLGLPIFFLQRHTIELAIKDVIAKVLSNRDSAKSLAASLAEWRAMVAAGPGLQDKDDFSHDLCKLIQRAERLLAEDMPNLPLPHAFRALAAVVDEFEEGHAERARYDEVSDKRSKKQIAAERAAKKPDPELTSLPVGKEVILRIGDLQDGIEALLDGELRCDSRADDDTFMAALAVESQRNGERLYAMGRL